MKTAINLKDKEGIFKGKFQHQISDHPISGLIRVIDYFGADISHRYKQIAHDAEMHFFTQEGEHLPEFTQKVKQRRNGKLVEWTVNNNYQVMEREADGQPKLGDDKQPIMHDAYDYFIEVVYNAPMPLNKIIIGSIEIDDSNHLFD